MESRNFYISDENSNGVDSSESSDDAMSDINVSEYFNYQSIGEFNDCNECIDETNFFEETDFSDNIPLHPSTSCTVHDALLMIYAYSVRHGLTWEATEDLAQLINKTNGNKKLTPSKYTFKKKIRKGINCEPTVHFVCHVCDLYLGKSVEVKNTDNGACPNCNSVIQTDIKYKKNHFITIPFASQLKFVLERNVNNLRFNYISVENEIRDVHDSINFQKLRCAIGNTVAITLTVSTDGAAVFQSTKEKSLWPLQFIVNEIDLKHRFKRENTFCAAISFGKTPNMHVLFKPFIEECMRINDDGGLIIQMKDGETKTIKIFPMIFTGDTPAKSYVLNRIQFNGRNGCPYCKHSGTIVDGQVRYCKRDNGPIRKNSEARENMLMAQETKEIINGYRGVSPLMAFDHFDVVWQVAIDKMHNIDMGVTKKLFNLFLDAKNRHKRYESLFATRYKFFYFLLPL